MTPGHDSRFQAQGTGRSFRSGTNRRFAFAPSGRRDHVWGLWRWRGGWRLFAAVPAAVMAFVVLRIVIDTTRDPTSHNLWPFEIVMWGGFSCGCMLLLGLAHKLLAAKRI